jgi:catechol 2,3-dioxygenase-like lactoylglutathione lyase family enzyme
MTSQKSSKAYVEHVAIRVKDIRWHMKFFYDVLDMDVRQVDVSDGSDPNEPRQYWSVGGVQLIHSPSFEAPPSNDAGWLAHLGIMVEDLDEALARAAAFGVTQLPQGRGWLQLPDGLAIELMQAVPASAVADALAINPRKK